MSHIKEEICIEASSHIEKDYVSVEVAVVVLGILSADTDTYRNYHKKKTGVLLICGSEMAVRDRYMLPKGCVYTGETLQEAAKRVLKEKTGLTGSYCEQVHTFDAGRSNVRSGNVTCAYMAVASSGEIPFGNAEWKYVDELSGTDILPDDEHILKRVLEHLKKYIYYTDILFHMVPEKFTLSQLQEIYESILNVKIFPIEFKRNIEHRIAETNEYSHTGPKRERLYRHKNTLDCG